MLRPARFSSRDPRALATGSLQPLVTTVSIAWRRYTPAFCKIMCRNRFLVPVSRWSGIPSLSSSFAAS